jgi:hypothetical protein
MGKLYRREWDAPAPTYVPVDLVGWWGGPDERTRCEWDKKVVLTESGAAKVSERTGMSVYTGKCGHIHVGHGGEYGLR